MAVLCLVITVVYKECRQEGLAIAAELRECLSHGEDIAVVCSSKYVESLQCPVPLAS